MPRFLHPDGLLRPYSTVSAEGSRLLLEAEKGRYSKELYEGHTWLTKGKQTLMLTDERIMILEKGEVFGIWKVSYKIETVSVTHSINIIILLRPLGHKCGQIFKKSIKLEIIPYV